MFTEVHAICETVKSFFFAHSIRKHGEQNIFISELVLVHLKHKVSTEHLLVRDLFGKKLFSCRY
jgi:hypothetical protein